MRLGAAAVVALVTGAGVSACSSGSARTAWTGTIDTLPSGRVVVHNPETGMWVRTGTPWRVDEVTRIGTLEGTGPEMLGSVRAIEVDRAGRIWIFEGQANELRVFDASGAYVRTIGRQGGGPGEFNQVIGMAWGPDGNLWVVDPQNNRISLIDTSGAYVGSHSTIGGFVIMPWPGGFDASGHFYTYAPMPSSGEAFGMRMGLVKYDSALAPMDTIETPRWTGPENFFELRNENSYMRATVPFSPGLQWHLARSGDIWFALTGEYRLFDVTQSGDTVREIDREFETVPVTGAEIDSVIGEMKWFTEQGGKIDRSKFPSTKPALQQFWLGDDGTIWVMPVEGAQRERGSALDVFDPDGRYLGRVTLPFTLASFPPPLFRRGMIYGVTRDELDVPYVVSARVVKP